MEPESSDFTSFALVRPVQPLALGLFLSDYRTPHFLQTTTEAQSDCFCRFWRLHPC
ncbi:hypothetical protein SACS_0883 [Parasaccharibacter apium]|uniref:Uncharacterized protein n=1 Tax=Parasaccharibacter apium TaxID=1510841 RepID=A0A7U7J0Y0_9PROT|nr:hypothetical protein SACS_0883 [Parasaccharibacter apium]